MKKAKLKGGHRMKQLGRVCVTVWFRAEQLEKVKESATKLREKTAAFVRQAALNRATDVRRQHFYG